MTHTPSDKKELLLSFTDIVQICQREKRKILYGTLCLALLALSFTLIRPVNYFAEGSFREKTKSTSPSERSFSSMLAGSLGQAESITVTNLKSRKILGKAAQELGLQASIQPKKESHFLILALQGMFQNATNNLEVAYQSFEYPTEPILKDPAPLLTVSHFHYEGEYKRSFELAFTSNTAFRVIGPGKKEVAKGELGKKISLQDVQFSIAPLTDKPLAGKSFILSFSSLAKAADSLRDRLTILLDKTDKTFLKLTYHHPDRHLASKHLNQILSAYREFLIEEHSKKAQEQVAYLKLRQEEMDKQLLALMEEHAENLSSSASNVEFLVTMIQGYKQKLLAIDLETKHLQKAKQEGLKFYGTQGGDQNLLMIHNLLAEIRGLRQQADSIELALNTSAPSDPDLLADNQNREFQGINLETAASLYLSYAKDLHTLEAEISQYHYVLDQIQQPDFEISSLSTVINDPISKEMITKSASIVYALKDEQNRTTKEQERMKQDLELQKAFLSMHLDQTAQVVRLKENLLKTKLYSLQQLTLELIEQKISILEAHLGSYTESRLNNLAHEKQVLLQHQKEMEAELEKLPAKWASQKLIDQHLQSNQAIVNEIARMIESKTLGENLDASQSAPFDLAIPPILPRLPHLFLFLLIGGTSGAMLSFCFVLLQSSSKGLRVAPHHLNSLHLFVAGSLSAKPSEENLCTLRRLATHLAGAKHASLLHLENHGPNISEKLAHILSLRGFTSCVIALDGPQEGSGLAEVLEGKVKEPLVERKEGFDWIGPGHTSTSFTDRLASPAFKELLKTLTHKYDFVIARSSSSPLSSDADTWVPLFDQVSFTLVDEKIQLLDSYTDDPDAREKFSFIFLKEGR